MLRTTGHEVTQWRIEVTLNVLVIVGICNLGVNVALFHGQDPQTLGLVTGQDRADQPTAYGIWLEQDECAL